MPSKALQRLRQAIADVPFTVPLRVAIARYPTAVAFGGGLNSTAVLVRWYAEDLPRPGKILFADTGGERPETYDYVAMFSDWLAERGFPQIEVTRKGGRPETLEQYSHRIGMFPSLAYGTKGCSHKFKIEPQNREVNRWPAAKSAWASGSKVLKIIGYGYDEQRRINLAKIEDEKYFYRFPLNEWRMLREDCATAIRKAGLLPPPKSACFFCPASTKPEILALASASPDLMRRALALEDRAIAAGKSRNVIGLGRKFAWRDFLAGENVETDPLLEGAACMSCSDD